MYDTEAIADARHFARMDAAEDASASAFSAWRHSLTNAELSELAYEFIGNDDTLTSAFTDFLRQFHKDTQA